MAVPSDGMWAVEVPEIPGLFTQARSLDQVGAMVADAAELLGHPKAEVTVVPVRPTEADATSTTNRR